MYSGKKHKPPGSIRPWENIDVLNVVGLCIELVLCVPQEGVKRSEYELALYEPRRRKCDVSTEAIFWKKSKPMLHSLTHTSNTAGNKGTGRNVYERERPMLRAAALLSPLSLHNTTSWESTTMVIVVVVGTTTRYGIHNLQSPSTSL